MLWSKETHKWIRNKIIDIMSKSPADHGDNYYQQTSREWPAYKMTPSLCRWRVQEVIKEPELHEKNLRPHLPQLSVHDSTGRNRLGQNGIHRFQSEKELKSLGENHRSLIQKCNSVPSIRDVLVFLSVNFGSRNLTNRQTWLQRDGLRLLWCFRIDDLLEPRICKLREQWVLLSTRKSQKRMSDVSLFPEAWNDVRPSGFQVMEQNDDLKHTSPL